MTKINSYKKIILQALPIILLLAGLYLVPIRIFETDFSKVPGDLGDARFNNYILEHGHKYLEGKVKNYWDAPFMYPYENVIAFSDNLLGTVPVYSAFRMLGFDRETGYQLWLLTLFILNFICCFWVLKRWSNNTVLSSTGAFLFSFSILLVGNIYNVQTFPRFIVPFVFYWSWKYLSQKQLKYFLLTSLGIVYQFYCGIYLGFLLIYTLLFLLISYLIIYRDIEIFKQFKEARKIGYHLLIIAIAGLILAPLMLPYLEVSHKLGMRKFEEVIDTIPFFRSYFFTSKAPVLWGVFSEHGITVLPLFWCHFLFIGALPWIGVALVTLVLLSKKFESDRKKFVAFLSLGLFLSFIFCLNFNGFTLYKIIFELPGFSSMRSINRIINTEIMYFVLIFVFVFKELSKSSRLIKLLVFTFPLLIILDNLIDPQEIMRYNKQESQKKISAIREIIQTQYDNKHPAIAYMHDITDLDKIEFHLSVMLAAQDLNIPCVNAYSGSYPAAFLGFFNNADENSLSKWCNFNNFEKNKIQQISDGKVREIRKIVNLKALNGKYIIDNRNRNSNLFADSDNPWEWETFEIIEVDKDKINIRSSAGKFVCADQSNANVVIANRNEAKEWETFRIINLENNFVAFLAANGKYLSVDKESLQLFAKGDSVGVWEKFTLMTK